MSCCTRHLQPRRAALALRWIVTLCSLVIGCGVAVREHSSEPRSGREASTVAAPSAISVICARDSELHSLTSRFRAEVDTGSGARSAEGLLVLRSPGSIRLKLFAFGGLTVYDGTWVLEREGLSGFVRLPFRGEVRKVRMAGSRSLGDPQDEMSYVLWALWQPRCVRAPMQDRQALGRFRLAPESSLAHARSVSLESDEVRTESIETLRSDGTTVEVAATYSDYDRSTAIPLARQIELADSTGRWRARVRVLSFELNPDLAPELFQISSAAASTLP